MPTVLPMTRVEAYLAYKAGVISESDLKPSLKTNFYSGLENWLAYWCGLTADYPKDENNDPKWYTEEEYYVAYLCGIAPDYPVNCYRRVGAYLRYIISARWDRPEKPLTREEYYLSLMSTTYLPPNDPASIITLDNTAEAPFGDLKIYGDTTQQTYSGKNLFDLDDLTYVGHTTYTSDGWATVDVDNSEGTSVIYANFSPANLPDTLLPTSTTCSIVAEIKSVSVTGDSASLNLINSHAQSQFSTTVSVSLADLTDGQVYVGTSTTKADYTGCSRSTRTYVSIAAGAKAKIVYRMSLIVGTSVTPDNFVYEPWTGGIPSPNPDFPMPIQVVTGGQTVSVVGKNLLPLVNQSCGQGSLYYSVDAGKLKMTGSRSVEVQKNASVFKNNFSFKLAAGTYTVSCSETGSKSGTINLYLLDKADDSTLVTITKNGSNSLTLTQETEIYLGIYSYQLTITDSVLYALQIEQGLAPSTYQSYQAQTYNVNLGKNLWGGFANDFAITPAGISFVNKDDGTIEVGAGTSTAEANSMNSAQARDNGRIKTLPAGRYTLSGSTSSIRLLVVDSTGYGLATSSNGVPASFTLSQKTGVFIRASIPANTTVEATVIRPQLEAGSTATTYAPYFTPIELCKIGTYQDYIYKTNGNWYKHAEVGKVVLTGDVSETWSGANSNTIYRYENATLLPIQPETTEIGGAISDYYTGNTYAKCYNGQVDYGVSLQKTNPYIVVRNKDIVGVSALRTWLSTHNTTVYYQLATATNTAITNTTLIAQLDALLEGGSYEPQTNITLTAADPNLPGLLQVTAAKWQ